MAKEHETGPVSLTAIHIDLKELSITFEAAEDRATRLTFSPRGVLYEILRLDPATRRGVERLVSAGADASQGREKEPTVTVTGRLKSRPREGRPDARGRPTAWARLAVHEEGRPDAHLYSATFHRHTASIALSLPKDAQITVQGYAHTSDDPTAKRMDTFSVVNIVNYPGKEERR